MAQELDFTIRQIEALKAPVEGRDEYRDAKVQGLYLRVTAAGAKSFSFVGRAKGSGRVERLTIGKYPTVKPDEARSRAREVAGRLASGVSVATVAREKRGEMTVDELWDLYFKYIGKANKSPERTRQTWETYLRPVWAAKRLSEVSATDVERWHLNLPDVITRQREEKRVALQSEKDARRREIDERQAVRRRGPRPSKQIKVSSSPSTWKVTGRVSANKALELLRAMFNFALEPKRQYFAGANPASKHKPYATQDRERFIQPEELRPFFQALADEPNEAMRDIFLLALLTGVRRANVLALRWADLSLGRGEWRIAGEFTKNGQPQTVTLGPEAVQILAQRQKSSASEFVFPSDRSKAGHINEPKSAWKRVKERAGLTDIRIHDLRRTLGSWQARTGASLVLIGKSLNHKDQQSTAIYARLDLDPVRQSVDRATSAMFEAAGLKPAAKLLAISKAPQAKGTKRRTL